jgi:hypothetical protein
MACLDEDGVSYWATVPARVDRDSKRPHENPSIGVLLCRTLDDEVVEYAMSRHPNDPQGGPATRFDHFDGIGRRTHFCGNRRSPVSGAEWAAKTIRFVYRANCGREALSLQHEREAVDEVRRIASRHK